MIDHVDWKTAAADLDELGMASIGAVLRPADCLALAGLYDDDGRFRSTIDMARHRFGEGEYRYFDRPLPDVVADLRAAGWMERVTSRPVRRSRLPSAGRHRPRRTGR